jgi:uncharacterized protein (DUF2236 family)
MERLWSKVSDRTVDPTAGIFGPSSVSWRVNRESALFLGAGRAALLQLAHPWVAAALDRHSNLRNDPLARFHNTFRVVFTMIFGTLDQALAASRHLYQLHTRIQGELPEQVGSYAQGSRYSANEVGALRWVYATLVESALVAYEAVLPALLPNERESYYAESKTMAALFGIAFESLPANWAAFGDYNREMYTSESLAVNRLSREMAERLLHGRGSRVPVPGWYRALTAAWLPERLRGDFGLPFGVKEEAAASTALRWLRPVYAATPGRIRFVGPYCEARCRLAGRTPGAMVRTSNRFWMGRSTTMFAGDNS